LAMNEGYRWKKKLFSAQGRAQLLDRMNPTIEELTGAVEREARKRPEAMRLMTHPGVGPLTALAYVLIIGTPSRFQRGKQIGRGRRCRGKKKATENERENLFQIRRKKCVQKQFDGADSVRDKTRATK